MKVPRLTLVMGPQDCPDGAFEEVLWASIRAGLPAFQYRVKDQKTRMTFAPKVLELVRGHKTQLSVNDDPSLACQMQADILHLGQDDLDLASARGIIGEGMTLGLSVRNEEEARACSPLAQYAGVGPVFGTSSKNDAAPALGPKRARAIADMLGIPVIFIGGINHDNLAELDIRPNEGVAVISAIASSHDPEQASLALLQQLAERS